MADSDGTDDYDIRGLDPEDAKQYIVSVMATLKQTTAKRIQLERDLDMWQKRIDLAVEKGRQDLIGGASRRVAEIQEDLSRLRGEEQEYSDGLSRMRRQLRMIREQPQMTVDVDLLAAQMEMLIGEREQAEAETSEQFRKAEAEWALEDLKRKLKDENE